MAEGDGIVYTTKELLNRIDTKIDRITEKLDTKADATVVTDLTVRVSTLEAEALRRTGPVAAEIERHDEAIREFRYALEKLQNGVGKQIQESIEQSKKAAIAAADRSLTSWEKRVAIGSGVMGAVGTFVSILVLFFVK